MRSRILILTLVAATAAFASACDDDNGDGDPATPETSIAATATEAVAPSPTGLSGSPTASAAVDPCTLRPALDGGALGAGPAFELDAQTSWQLCLGGVAAGSGEKLLFRSADGGASWTLISRTTLGNPPAEAGVGDLPNGNGVTQILFLDEQSGWLAMNSPGDNLWRSTDGGVSWSPRPELPPAVPVTSIAFTDALNGTAITSESTWTTTDGGDTWVETP